MASDKDWLAPSAGLTGLLGAAAIALVPFVHLNHPAAMLWSLAGWAFWTLAAIGASIVIYTIRLMKSDEPDPIRRLISERAGIDIWPILAGMALGGIDMFFFMWLKPELNAIFPFWADHFLAGIDHAIFGIDPWRLLTWMNVAFVGFIYNLVWFLGVQLTFYWLMLKPPSPKKTAGVVSYFLIWSLFGPIGQALLSSAGPIFYDRLDYGNRFAAMPTPDLVKAISAYLWAAYQARGAGVGVGISAMPSLHIASMAWAALAFFEYRSRLAWAGVGLTAFMWAGSILLGWHYASDGLAGLIGAIICFQFGQSLGSIARSSASF